MRPLPEVAGELTATGQMTLRTQVSVTGHSVIEGSGHTYRFLTTIGQWAGPAMRDDAVPIGRMTAEAVVPGMSGAPVIRDSDGAVAGVVSGRYNSADGWLAGTVWVARTEDLLPLLDGITTVNVQRPPLAGPVDLLLTVTADQVQLTGPGSEWPRARRGRAGLAEAVNEMRRSRARAGLPVRAQTATGDRPGSRRWAGRPGCWGVVPARTGPRRAGPGAGGGGAGASAGPARPGRPAGAGRAAVGGAAQAGWARPAGPAPAGQLLPQGGRGIGPGAAGAAADRGHDRRPRYRRRCGAGL